MITQKNNCSGCTACQQLCPKKCISMKLDQEGFLYPIIDQSKCIKCGICEKKCPANQIKSGVIPYIFYVSKNKDDEIRKKSSSGGIFHLLATNTIKNKGKVIGAAFDQKFQLKHLMIEKDKDLSKLMGSKYLQSEMENIYSEVQKELKNGIAILFSGTPCQIKGLNSYLGQKYDNLLSVDIICHGVPSPKVFKKYKKQIENQIGESQKISFRSKKIGWKKFSLEIKSATKEYSETLDKDPYMQGFLKDLYLRPSCYNCSSNNYTSGADITLGDCWGIEDINAKFDDDQGISVISINTEKGTNIFNLIKDKLDYFELNKEIAEKNNPCLISSVLPHKNRKKFFEELDKTDNISKLINKNIKESFYKRSKQKTKTVIKKLIGRA